MTVIDASSGGTSQTKTVENPPYQISLTDNPTSVGVVAQSTDPSDSAAISCEIEFQGDPPIANASFGPYAVTNCNATKGSSGTPSRYQQCWGDVASVTGNPAPTMVKAAIGACPTLAMLNLAIRSLDPNVTGAYVAGLDQWWFARGFPRS